ncbi:MAG TPA: acetate--CoA ligase family protein [Sphingomicrobium sp.]|nr:acetate--CoA ligase family protein [Sphingomicrobium sp.]
MTSHPTRAEIIARLIDPRSVAVIGASADFGKVSGRPLKHLIQKGYKGKILPVNPKHPSIDGIVCYASVDKLPDVVDLAVVAVPARDVLATIESLGHQGIRAAVIFSSGFAETGADGRAMEEELVRKANSLGMLVCGPNCLGFINAFSNVYATFSQYADGEGSAGPIGFVTQSGAFGTAIAALARQRGLGLGYFINTGNEADISFSELMMAVVEDPRIRVAAGYLEGLDSGDELVRLMQRCRELEKPLVLTKVGRMASGVRAASSHTGALAVSDAVFDAVIRQYGALRARNEEQMLDMLSALIGPRSVDGNGLGIATQSGGAGVMMADRAEEVGLTVPMLTADTQNRLASVMPTFGASGNPVDVTGEFVGRPELLRESVVALMDDPNVHVGIVWLQLMTAYVDTLVRIFTEIRDRTTKPVFVCWVAAPEEALRRLRELDITVFSAGERAVESVAAVARYQQFLRQVRDTAARAAPPPTAVADGLKCGVQPTIRASEWLSAAGVPMAPVALSRDADEAVRLWRSAGRPVALKIESTDITHKSDIGGVLLNLNDEHAIRDGFQALMRRAGEYAPNARMQGVIVQTMSGGHIELAVGVKRDPVFGMIIMAGFGGVLVEVLKDVAFRRAPFDAEEGERMLRELRMTALFDGVRGQSAVDRRAIAQMLSNLSQWAVAAEPMLEELDLNPVLVDQSGPVAVDCVMVLKAQDKTG